MKVYTAPEVWDKKYNYMGFDFLRIFLAGSIEQDKAVQWQNELIKELGEFKASKWIPELIIFNPRRKSWDPSWLQRIDNPEFKKQVLWELNAMHNADITVFYFDPNSKSPVTMLELGSFKDTPEKVLVYCPEGFFKKGNVDIFCEKYNITYTADYSKFLKFLKDIIEYGL